MVLNRSKIHVVPLFTLLVVLNATDECMGRVGAPLKTIILDSQGRASVAFSTCMVLCCLFFCYLFFSITEELPTDWIAFITLSCF